MLIELWRRVLATDYSRTYCGICGNDFDRGTVFPVAFTDGRETIGEMCPPCLDHLNRRKEDADDPTGGPAPYPPACRERAFPSRSVSEPSDAACRMQASWRTNTITVTGSMPTPTGRWIPL